MKIKILLVITLLLILQNAEAKSIDKYKFDEFEYFLHFDNDTTYVINFWATWCVPCRKELPEFEKIHSAYKNKKVKVLLVSLDFASKIESSLIPYIEKNNITANVILLNDPNSNAWIDKVNPGWSGSIPATLIYKKEKQFFFEKELTYEDIESTIIKLNTN